MTTMRKWLWAGGSVAVLGIAAYLVLTQPARIAAADLPPHAPDLANGRTLFFVGGCAACHATPKQDNRLHLGGGLPLPSPFGTFYAPNISPHPDDGIGRWSEADFVTAVLKGTSPEGAHYFPAFPYTSYARMKPTDVRDVFAFLKTLMPVAGRAPDHAVPFPFNIRRNLGVWKRLFLPAAAEPASDRGAYLVLGPGHCAECHSPRNALGGIVGAQSFAGGPNPEGKGWVPNITGKGLADWSEKDVAYFLETGLTPDGDSAGGAMARVIANTSQLSDADRAAMARFLKSLPAVEGPPRPPRS